MWRSNVLRVRIAASAVRYGARIRRYSSLGRVSDGTVSDEEFLDALGRLLVASGGLKRNYHGSIGLAISGGVDSMALATLYTRARERHSSLPPGHGVIIDHKVRSESTEEARWVAEQLRKYYDPKQTARFESDARIRRYQALGQLCKEKGISRLLTGHHGDDQAETILLRMINRRLRAGLQAMHEVQSIPECYGIHGVHRSGGLSDGQLLENNPSTMPFPIEQGGVQILRPLLGFEKSRLIATCEQHRIEWAEDSTNTDKTLTPRNAIRHVMQNHKLPRALSSSALVQVAGRMQDRISSLRHRADMLFDNSLSMLDLKTGSLIIRFPSLEALLERPIVTESDRLQARNVAHYLMLRVVELVTPTESAAIGQLATAVDTMYPDPDISTGSENDNENVKCKAFCVWGVWFRPWDRPSPFVRNLPFPVKNKREWILSRQPFDEHKQKDQADIIIPPASPGQENTDKWHFVDGRFWLRVTNRSSEELIIRPFTDLDFLHQLSDVRKRGKDPAIALFRTALKKIKPADLRRSIPGLFTKSIDGKEDFVALPTLLPSTCLPEQRGVQYEVRYKKVELDTRNPKHVIAPGFNIKKTKGGLRIAKRGEKGKTKGGWETLV